MPQRKPFVGRRLCLRKAPRDHTLIGLCVMYCGTGFRGMQLQKHAPTHHTVEGVLIQALKDIGLVEVLKHGRIAGDSNRFARSCRTDRGVHATRNLVSLFVSNEKLEELGSFEHLVERLNALLPVTVRVARVTPLMGNFIPRFQCNGRVYHYMIPAYALVAPCDTWKSFYERFPNTADSLSRHSQTRSFVDLRLDDTEDWHVALAAVVTRANELLQSAVVGTHRFHNFSVDPVKEGGPAWNRKVIMPHSNEAVRTIRRCEIAPRVFLLPRFAVGPTRRVYEQALETVGATGSGEAEAAAKEGDPPDTALVLPFVVFQIEGNSFLFNMIRKIVGMVLAVMRGSRETLVTEALSPERRVTCPLAPGPYLYLSLSVYHCYDELVRSSKAVRFRPIGDEWRGDVAAAAATFVKSSVATDIVDIDLNRTPAVGTLLVARDNSQRVVRPCWEVEDSHLSMLKEYRPAVVESHPRCSEMTTFLRSLRVHNWNIEVLNPQMHSTCDCPEDRNVGKDINTKEYQSVCSNDQKGQKRPRNEVAEGNKKIRAEENHSENGDTAAALQMSHERDDDKESVDDGWLYVGPTDEAERCRRREYHQNVRARSRPSRRNMTPITGKPTEDWNSDGCGSE